VLRRLRNRLNRPRSFRQHLALSIAFAAIAAAVLEGVLDVAFDSQIARFRQENTAILSQESATIALFLEFEGDEVSLPETALARLDPDTRFRLLRGDEVVLASPGAFPQNSHAWAVREGFVGENYRLEIARPTSPLERLILNELFLDILDLPVFFLLALMVAWLLVRFALRPVRELTTASQLMAAQHSPMPIAVPPGDDELSQMARSFNRMQHSVQTLLERERAFTRYASHELRTPLSALKVQVEALELGLKPPEAVVPVLARNVVRMEQVIAALLALARSGERSTEETALQPLLRDLLGSFMPEARARIREQGLEGGRIRVVNAQLIVQAVQNLLENALRYSEGDVLFDTEIGAEEVVFTIRDFGPGVPENALRHLTQPFYRRGEHRESIGLGLALVESISRTLAGRLELRNAQPGLEAKLVIPIGGGG
jgi:signal transduction histidine kinase